MSLLDDGFDLYDFHFVWAYKHLAGPIAIAGVFFTHIKPVLNDIE